MQVWLFDIMMWAYPGERTTYPFPGRLFDRELGRQFFDDHLRLYIRADEVGYDAVCFAEHHYGTQGLCASPNVMAAAVATRTSHVKLALMGNSLPLHGHPVRVAEEIAMLDVLSNGRVIAGLFRGGFVDHYAYKIDQAESRQRFEEAWELIVRAWTSDEPFEWNGKYFQYETVSILPRPMQLPYPRMVMAGNTPESLQWAARQRVALACSFGTTEYIADAFKYYRDYAESECGWKPGPEHCIVSRQVYVSETRAKARQEAEEHLLTFYHENPVLRPFQGKLAELRRAKHLSRDFNYKTGEQRAPDAREHTAPATPPDMSFERFQRDGMCIVGDPDHVATEMRRQAEIMGAGVFLTYIPFGTLPVPQAMKSVELFAREVLPNVRDAATVPVTA